MRKGEIKAELEAERDKLDIMELVDVVFSPHMQRVDEQPFREVVFHGDPRPLILCHW